ncbi:hypothetical protein NDU88_006044 [Pleurodeles waltl]|uniref:Reverse transcriptase domain-containing protein n=1 Tax=Pleurodeles waltl TaxID=8319 RepID=A0AAV7VNM6_PLEWA|nr:hypothetical protein NDU88_006044 [Pleurodeles waltl]
MDIEALYTNIPQQEAWQAVASLFEKEDMTEHTAFVLQCLDIVLRENFFEFDNQIFQQMKGVSMGAACAPSVANIYVGSFEEKYVYNEIAPFFENIHSWSRFIDDIFFIWTGEEESLLEFNRLPLLRIARLMIAEFQYGGDISPQYYNERPRTSRVLHTY